MPIKVTNQTINSATIEIDNGDLKAFNQIQEKWGFINLESALRFALAVLMLAEDKTIYLDQEGKKEGLTPSQSLLVKEKPTEPV